MDRFQKTRRSEECMCACVMDSLLDWKNTSRFLSSRVAGEKFACAMKIGIRERERNERGRFFLSFSSRASSSSSSNQTKKQLDANLGFAFSNEEEECKASKLELPVVPSTRGKLDFSLISPVSSSSSGCSPLSFFSLFLFFFFAKRILN